LGRCLGAQKSDSSRYPNVVTNHQARGINSTQVKEQEIYVIGAVEPIVKDYRQEAE
jgi:hypothetical protein